MNIADSDKSQKNIEEAIEGIEKTLRNNYVKLKKNNDYKSVLKIYEDFYNKKYNKKDKQYNVFNKILNHLDDISNDISLTKEQLNKLKSDKKIILKEIKCLHNDIDLLK